MEMEPQSHFEPLHQLFSILGPDGKTPIPVSMDTANLFNIASMNACISYGTQLGACIIMLLAVVFLTPMRIMRRPSTILNITNLVLCIIRTVLLILYFPSLWNNLYIVFSGDYTYIPPRDYQISVAANTMSLLLVITLEAALIFQAWTLVSLWSRVWKWIAILMSIIIVLLTVGFRIASTVLYNRGVLNLMAVTEPVWVLYASLLLATLSIVWFCTLFNVRLVMHLVQNRGFLARQAVLNPMEILAITNGVLMVIPVIFAGLQWGSFSNFEPASWTFTSVVLILPLGNLIAQRISTSTFVSKASNPSNSKASSSYRHRFSRFTPGGVTSTVDTEISAARSAVRRPLDPVDKELQDIDGNTSDGIQVEHQVESREERI